MSETERPSIDRHIQVPIIPEGELTAMDYQAEVEAMQQQLTRGAEATRDYWSTYA